MTKGFKGFFINMVLVLTGLVTVVFLVAFSYRERKVDVIGINDLVQTAKENWGDFSSLEDIKKDMDFIIFDSDNNELYSSDSGTFSNIKSPMDALTADAICASVNEGEHFLGTVVVARPEKGGYGDTMRRILIVIIIMVLSVLLSYIVFFLYVNKNIIRPFRRMKHFAAQVAQGNLDEPLIMEKNNVFGVFTESFDIMREELAASKNREHALKMKEKELVASLSHDLKTPVTGIRVICELLSVKVEDAYVKGKINDIEKKTQDISILLNDLLSTTLDDLGELNVKCTEENAEILTKLLDEHDTKKKAATGNLPGCIIKVDKTRLSQVIGNVISNSYKYADTKIDVSYRFVEEYLEMKIADHGKGVAPEELPLLTNKFYRGKENAAGKEGSGLGLYISSELMKKMGGELICASGTEEAPGLTVTLLLPLA